MATEINVKVPPLAQSQLSPSKTAAPAAPPATLPQKPATRSLWLSGDPEPAQECLKLPEGRPDIIVFIKTKDGYAKAMEIDKGGDSLFGSGAVASEFTEILTEAISRKLSVTCKAVTGSPEMESISGQLALVREQLEAKRRQDEFAMVLLGVGLVAAVLCTIVYLVLAKLQSRRR